MKLQPFVVNLLPQRSLRTHPERSSLWSIVLAGGEGNRIRPFIQSWLGRHLPKQYCTFTGTRSLLQHTVDRAKKLTPDQRTLVVIDRTHRQIAEQQFAGHPCLQVIQPCNRDTGPGIFLPLSYVRRFDPRATVVICPSDHFIYPEETYNSMLQEAIAESATLNRVVLLGADPDGLEMEYGWIFPGPVIGGNGRKVWAVRSFIEKPSLPEAKAAMEIGALWNTFVLVGKVEKLWQLGWDYMPEIMPLFERITNAIGTPCEKEVIRSVYENMPSRNFSAQLLQAAPKHVAVIKLADVLWSDWGCRDRIIRSLGIIHRQPTFATG